MRMKRSWSPDKKRSSASKEPGFPSGKEEAETRSEAQLRRIIPAALSGRIVKVKSGSKEHLSAPRGEVC